MKMTKEPKGIKTENFSWSNSMKYFLLIASSAKGRMGFEENVCNKICLSTEVLTSK